MPSTVERERVPYDLTQLSVEQLNALLPACMPSIGNVMCTRCHWRVRRTLGQRYCRACHNEVKRERRAAKRTGVQHG